MPIFDSSKIAFDNDQQPGGGSFHDAAAVAFDGADTRLFSKPVPAAGGMKQVLGIASESDKAARSEADYLFKPDTLRKTFVPVPALAVSQVVQGVGGKVRQVGDVVGSEGMATWGDEFAEMGAGVEKTIQEAEPLEQGSWANSIRGGATSMYQQLPSMVAGGPLVKAGMKAAGLATSLLPMGAVTGGQSYQKLRERGFDVGAASAGSAVDELIEVGTELLPMNTAMSFATSKAKFGLKQLAATAIKYNAGEYFGEALAAMGQGVNDKYLSDPKLTPEQRQQKVDDYFSVVNPQTGNTAAWDDFTEAMRATTAQNVMMMGLGGAANRVSRSSQSSGMAPEPPASVAGAPQDGQAVPVLHESFDDIEDMPAPSGPLQRAAGQAPVVAATPVVPAASPAPAVDAPPVVAAVGDVSGRVATKEDVDELPQAREWAARQMDGGNKSLWLQDGESQRDYSWRILDPYREMNKPRSFEDSAVAVAEPSELDRAVQHNQELWQSGQRGLMQNTGTSPAQFESSLLRQYRVAMEKQNGANDQVPALRGAAEMDGQGMAVPEVQGPAIGAGSDNTQPEGGGLTNGLSALTDQAGSAPNPKEGQAVVSKEGFNGDVAIPKTGSNSLEGKAAANFRDNLVENKGLVVAGGVGKLGESSDAVKSEPLFAKSSSQSVNRDAQLVGDILGRDTFNKQGFRSLDAKTQLGVVSAMSRLVHDPQILDSVIKLVPVNMVDVLASRQLTPKMLFHDPSMLKDALSGNSNSPVSIDSETADSLVRGTAAIAAKHFPGLGDFQLGGGPVEDGSTFSAITDHNLTPEDIIAPNIHAKAGVNQPKEGVLDKDITNKDAPKVIAITSPKPPATSPRRLDSSTDSLIVAVAKLGGISRDQIDKQMGNGKELARTLNTLAGKEAKTFLHVISTKGMPLDRMREALVEQGYLKEGSSVNDLLDRLDAAQRGTSSYSTANSGAAADKAYDAELERLQDMMEDMTEAELAEFTRNQWLEEQAGLLAEASDLLDEYLDGLNQEDMTAADWQAVENDLKEALDATEFRTEGDSTADQGKVSEDATGAEEGVSAVGEGDGDGEGKAEVGGGKGRDQGPGTGKDGKQLSEGTGTKTTTDTLDVAGANDTASRTTSPSLDDTEPLSKNAGPSVLSGENQTPLIPGAKTALDDSSIAHDGKNVKQETPAARFEAGGTIVPDLIGEKIGGARKDLATSTGTVAKKKPKSDLPAWKRRYVVMEDVKTGQSRIVDTTTNRNLIRRLFTTAEEAEEALPLAVVALKHKVRMDTGGTYKITREVTERKRVTIKDGFPTEEAAMKYMVQHAEEIIEQSTYFGAEILARPEKVVRSGAERRSGNATGQAFMDAFGFRSAEFGNWNNAEERQEILNHAYDGLVDLAEVLNIPPKALSLNGELAIAFGARGQGLSGAAAHYEPAYAVINLTKMSGAGNLAHEWFHAVDNYLSRQDGSAKSEKVKNKRGDMVYPATGKDMASLGFSTRGSGVREEVRDAFKSLLESMFYKAEQYVEDTEKAEKFVGSALRNVESRLADIRRHIARDREYGAKKKAATAEQLARFDELAAKLASTQSEPIEWKMGIGVKEGAKAKDRGAFGQSRWTNDTIESISTIMKEVTGRSGFSKEGKDTLNYLASVVRDLQRRHSMLEGARNQDVKTKKIPTSYRQEAYKIDQGRTSDYWTKEEEMAARAFSAYIEDKIGAEGNTSDFLSFGSDNKYYRLYNIMPFPEGKEREAINKQFDNFFSTLKTKETDKGVAMFSLAQSDKPSILPDVEFDAVLDRITGGRVKDTHAFVVARTGFDLPAPILAVLKKQGTRPNQVDGVFHNGKVYLIRENIASKERLEELLFHEWHGHAGLYAMFDNDGKRLWDGMLKLYHTITPAVLNKVGAKYGINLMRYSHGMAKAGYSTDEIRVVLMEEMLAHLTNEYSRGDIATKIREMIGKIRAWLRDNGYASLASWGETDIAFLLKRARIYAESGVWAKNSDTTVIPSGAEILKVLREKGISDEMLQKLLNASPKFMTAWHGSPHDHNKFSNDHIGTGEGAQVYGYGLYFAGNREVAEFYRSKLTGGDKFSSITINGEPAGYYSKDLVATKAINAIIDNNGDVDAALKNLLERVKESPFKSLRNNAEAAVKFIRQNKIEVGKKGKLYQVELAPSEDEYLLWDKPLSEQSEKVREVLETVMPLSDAGIREWYINYEINNPNAWELHREYYEDAPAFDAPNTVKRSWLEESKADWISEAVSDYKQMHGDDRKSSGREFYFRQSSLKGSDKAASEYLHSLGIRGIKYLDGNSRNRSIKDIKKAFLAELEEDAGFDDVMELVGTGKFSAEQEAVLKALESDDWLGFDYPAQAISAALGNNLSDFDPSSKLVDAVAQLAKDQQFNYVIFNDEDVSIQAKFSIREDQPSVTETEAFKKWFGKSKVVDDQGKPLVVYHGTRADIKVFNMGDEGGTFFTTSPENASEYAGGWGEIGQTEGGNVMPVYLSIKNPYVVTVKQWNMAEGLDPEDAKAEGYDGYVIEEQEGGDTWIAFEPSQIKSATGNNGDFDGNNPDIRFSIREDTQKVSTVSTVDKIKQFLNPLDYSRFKDSAVDHLPNDATMWLADNIGNPYWVKENNPAAAPFYEEAKDREVTKLDNNIRMFGGLVDNDGKRTAWDKIKDLGQWSEHTTAWGKLRKEKYDKLTDKQKAAYTMLRFEGDAYNKTYETLSNALRNPRIKKAGVDAAVFDFYREALAAEEASFEEKLQIAAENMAEAGIDPEKIKGHIAEYRARYADLKGWVHRDHGEGDHVVQVYHTIDRLDFVMDEVQHKGAASDRIRLAYSPGVEISRAIEKITSELGGTFKQLRDGGMVILLQKGQGEFARERFDRLKLTNKDGKHKYQVLVYTRFVANAAQARKLAAEVKANPSAAMPRNYYEGHSYATSWNFSNKLQEADFQELRTSDMKMELVLSQAVNKAASKEGLDESAVKAIQEALVQNVAEALLGRGAGLYQIRRANHLIEGYDQTDAVKKYEDYVNSTAGMFSKARYALRQFHNMKNVAPKLRNWATRYFADSLRNMGAGDRLSGNVRAVVSLWYLGFNASWMLVNSTQPLVLGQAELSRYTESPFLKIAKAEKDLLTGNLTEEEKGILQEHATITQDRDSMMAEMTGALDGVGGKASKALHGAVQVAMALGQKVEVLNRHTMIIAAYRVMREKNMDRAEAYRKALEINSAVNIDMGRYNLPRWARGPVGRTFYSLQSYIQHMLNYLYHRSSSGNRADQKAVLRLLFAMFLLGGAPVGAPGSDELDKLIQRLFGYSPKLALKGWTRKFAQEYASAGEMLEGFVWHGIPGAFKPFGVGVSLTGATQLRIPIISNMIAGDDMTRSLTGPVGGLVQKGVMAGKALQRGDATRAVEYLAPTVVGNMMSAVRQSTDGVKTGHGKRVDYKGKPLKMEPQEAVLRAVGLQPVRTADISETRGKQFDLSREWRERRQDALDNYRNSRKLKYVAEFNRELKASQAAGIINPITADSMKQVWGKPDKKKAAWEKRYGVE